jgi:ankyrin repeat protein
MGPPPLRPADAALLAAARNQRWREALTLIKAGANPSARDAAGGCVLALAARDGQEELLRELLARGADANCSSEHGFTALGAAAFEGRVGTVRALLLQGADATRWGATGLAPLHLAALTGQVGVLQELLKAQQRGASVDLLSRQRETALDLAAAAGHGDAMDLLIARGADLAQAGRR